MRLSEARHRAVVATTTADTLGRIEGFAIEPGPARITALRVGKAEGDGTILPWGELIAFGADVVTIAEPGLIRRPTDDDRRADADFDLIGKPALAETGTGLGTVTDADFDPSTGTITAVITDAGEFAGADLIGVGTYAAVFKR